MYTSARAALPRRLCRQLSRGTLAVYCWLTSYHCTLGLEVSTYSKGCVDLCSIPHTGIVMPKKIFNNDFCFEYYYTDHMNYVHYFVR